jgi:hypothetical protein
VIRNVHTQDSVESSTTASATQDKTMTGDTQPAGDATWAAVQHTVDLWSAAYTAQSTSDLRATVDQSNLAFWRTQQAWLHQYAVSQQAGSAPWKGIVRAIVPLTHGYIRATVDFGLWRRPWIFKQVGHRWLLSEPRRAELGKPLTRETEHFTLRYYGWDAGIIDDLARLSEKVHVSDVKIMGSCATSVLESWHPHAA